MLEYPNNRNIMCIDLRGFYASCECVMRGLDPMTDKLAVVGNLERQGSIVLAISPGLKKLGYKNRCRFYELPKDQGIIMAPARMKAYLEFSQKIIEIFLKYVPREDLHIYSIDESFLDVTDTMHLFTNEIKEMARIIMADIFDETGLKSACGIGPNMLLAKLSLDLEAKKNPDGIAYWLYEDVERKLWPVTPLSEMWGIGRNLEKTLNLMGMYKVGDIAKYDVNKLSRKLGIIGEELYYHSHGIDRSLIRSPHHIHDHNYGIGQTLFEDYYENIRIVMLEQCEELGMRIRLRKRMGKTIHLSIGYSKDVGGGGFSRQMTLDEPTNITHEIYEACEYLFNKFYDGRPIRTIAISIGKLSEDRPIQLGLFEDRARQQRLAYVMDEIRNKFGKKSILRGVSYLDKATSIRRSKLIGGHYAELKYHKKEE
ncbi:type VI secretion protein ImpB [Mycoplasmatota bacterium]|nr:type VI secretion protein ImpB [Mycoplasmatota bacterium]